MTDPTPTPPPEVRDYDLGESVGYLISRVKSTMSNMVTQRAVAELGVTSQQASILFMVATGKCTCRRFSAASPSICRPDSRLRKWAS